jgi:hypothetical protein
MQLNGLILYINKYYSVSSNSQSWQGELEHITLEVAMHPDATYF